MTILNIKDLSFSYAKDNVLENINLSIEDKDFLAIIGPNGGGKSTLLKLILSIEKPKKGSIEVFGKSISKDIKNIGYVPQNTNVNTDFPIKVVDVVLMGHIQKEDKSKNKNFLKNIFSFGYNNLEISCATQALKRVGMEQFLDNKIGDLSGGQRQRVMIARALCTHPDILFLDEPTASIDVDGQKMIYDLLKELNKTITIVVVSHDISIILGYANKVAHINKNIVFHDISKESKETIDKTDDGHFCEVEMLQMLGKCKC